MKQQITVKYVNAPSGRGPASVKDETGQLWTFWTNKVPLAAFSVGGSYSVEYEINQYKDKEQRTITGVMQTGYAPAAPSQSGQPLITGQPAGTTNTKDEQIAVLALLKEWMRGIPIGDQAGVEHAMRVLRRAYRNAMLGPLDRPIGGIKEKALQVDPELNDEIPY